MKTKKWTRQEILLQESVNLVNYFLLFLTPCVLNCELDSIKSTMVCCFQEVIKLDRTDLHALRWPLLPLISSVPSHPSDPILAHRGASHLQSTAENIYSNCFMKSNCVIKSLRHFHFPCYFIDTYRYWGIFCKRGQFSFFRQLIF